MRRRNEEFNWIVNTNKELRVFKPQVIKTLFKYKEDDIVQKEEDIEEVRREHVISQMDPNRLVA